jgi:hypothetical protein
MIDDSHRKFLLGPARADKVRHSGRSLYEHLCGTHDLLQAWGNREPVCTAGLFHSIYGTRRFRHRAWPFSDRRTIVDLIGPEAERLACVFCWIDHRHFFEATRWGMDEVLRSLLEIEAANLLEQRSKSGSLQRLRRVDISDGAKRDIDQYLKAMV